MWLNGKINNLSIQIIDWTLQINDNDSGVLACLYIFAKYQGILPINIELFSKKRREILFRWLRDKDLAKLTSLFYEMPQTKLLKNKI